MRKSRNTFHNQADLLTERWKGKEMKRKLALHHLGQWKVAQDIEKYVGFEPKDFNIMFRPSTKASFVSPESL